VQPLLKLRRKALKMALRLALACLPGGLAYAQDQDPGQAAQRLEHIRHELHAIASERRQLESRRGSAAQQLRRADEQVSAAARALRETQAQLRKDEAALNALRLRRNHAVSRLAELRAEFARLVHHRYTRGERNLLKEVFSREHSGAREQTESYQDYLQHRLHQHITSLQDELAGFERLEDEIGERQRTLEAVLNEQQQRTRELERERLTRAQTQALLESQYANHTAREHALGQDIRALEQLLARLRAAAPIAAPNQPAAAPLQPGHLAWPLNGRLIHRFGQRLSDGRRSNGLLIDAQVGAQVHAVADGAVVFSEWMTGYGLLLIIDHGDGKMSLYAHNESLLKQAGDAVRRSEVIASVGHSGGRDISGLYFELRQDGQPVNPEVWLQRD